MSHPWLSDRANTLDSSGIRKVFDLAAKMQNPINLSIGQPDFDVPDKIKASAITAIQNGKNAYSQTQGIGPLVSVLQEKVDATFGQSDRKLLVTSGTSGGLVIALLAMLNPGDEVIMFDPYFVMYPSLVKLVGGTCVYIDTYPDFGLDVEKVKKAITPKTKLILLNSPANPTGKVASESEVKQIAELAKEKNIALISDEIYSRFCYETALTQTAEYNDQTIVIDGFSKTYGMTGWRIGYIHGPSAIIDKMAQIQQYTFVCAPHPLQWAAIDALDFDVAPFVDSFKSRRDLIYDGLRDAGYEVEKPEGAFYIFPKAPWGTGTKFVETAIANELLIIPGGIFSRQDTHFRISYAASVETIERGVEVLRKIVRG